MSSVIGTGTIELSADSTKLKAGVDDAKKSIRGLGKDIGDSMSGASAKASRSIDNYVKKLQTAAATQGMSARQTEIYNLQLRGASKAQLEAADSALKMAEGYQRGIAVGEQLRVGFISLAAAATTAGIGAALAANALIGQVGAYQDLSEKIGDTAVNISSLKTASDVSGVSIDSIATASIKLTAALSKTDDESKAAGAAIEALGLNYESFKKLSPVQQLESAAQALEGFADGSEKTAVAVSLFGKAGAELLPFLREYAANGLKAAYITDEQARAADEFSDAQARLKSEVQQFLQVSAVGAIPVLNQIIDVFKDIAKSEDTAAGSTKFLSAALSGSIIAFQAVSVTAANVAFVFAGVTRQIGSIAARLEALATLDFSGFNAISDAVADDAVRARAQLDKLESKIMSIGEVSRKVAATTSIATFGTAATESRGFKPKIDASGLNQDKRSKPAKDNSVAQEAKAQLAFDLDEIRKAGTALTDAYGNSEKILEALRSAGLADEREYYEAKLGFLNLNSAAQQRALELEIGRLRAEKVAGKDAIDNARKIQDVEAKLAKVRADTAANGEVLSIQQASAADRIEVSFLSAQQAAQDYYDTVNRGYERETAAIGAGRRARELAAGLAQVEDKYQGQRRDLQNNRAQAELLGNFGPEAQRQYEKQLALIEEFQAKSIASFKDGFDRRKGLERDWSLGANEALKNYFDDSQNVYAQVESLFTNNLKGMEDALVDFVKTGKLDFKSLADSIIADISRIIIKQQIVGPLSQSIGLSGGGAGGFLSGFFNSLFGGGGATVQTASQMGASFDSMFSNYRARAIGGPVSAGGMYRVNENGPELLSVAGKQYLMTGSQGGTVSPDIGGGGGGVTVNLNQSFAPGTNKSTVGQAAVAVATTLQRWQARNG